MSPELYALVIVMSALALGGSVAISAFSHDDDNHLGLWLGGFGVAFALCIVSHLAR